MNGTYINSDLKNLFFKEHKILRNLHIDYSFIV